MFKSKKNEFRSFYDNHFTMVYHFFLKNLDCKSHAKDLTQDTFIKIYNNFRKVKQAKSIKGYVYAIARNLLIDEQLANNRIKVTKSEIAQEKKTTKHINTTDSSLLKEQKLVRLEHLIDNLPEQRKLIFKLKKVDGFSTDEIASKLSISKRTVENQVYRALSSLKKEV